MSECCSNCRNRLHGIKTDFGKLGTDQDIDTPMEGYICLALAFEGVAYWMVNHDESKGMCEMYRPMADRKTENNSEKQNNCEDEQDWKDRMWSEAIVTEPTTEDSSTVSTSSKMEQVDKDINVRSKDEPTPQEYEKWLFKEPQTEREGE